VPNCQYGYQSSCMHREFITQAQAPVLRVPPPDGMPVPTPGVPSDDLLPSLLTTSDVLGTDCNGQTIPNLYTGGYAGLLSINN
jgi:hypothetical protein